MWIALEKLASISCKRTPSLIRPFYSKRFAEWTLFVSSNNFFSIIIIRKHSLGAVKVQCCDFLSISITSYFIYDSYDEVVNLSHKNISVSTKNYQ